MKQEAHWSLASGYVTKIKHRRYGKLSYECHNFYYTTDGLKALLEGDECPHCNGSGVMLFALGETPCDICNGTGRLHRILTVKEAQEIDTNEN